MIFSMKRIPFMFLWLGNEDELTKEELDSIIKKLETGWDDVLEPEVEKDYHKYMTYNPETSNDPDYDPNEIPMSMIRYPPSFRKTLRDSIIDFTHVWKSLIKKKSNVKSLNSKKNLKVFILNYLNNYFRFQKNQSKNKYWDLVFNKFFWSLENRLHTYIIIWWPIANVLQIRTLVYLSNKIFLTWVPINTFIFLFWKLFYWPKDWYFLLIKKYLKLYNSLKDNLNKNLEKYRNYLLNLNIFLSLFKKIKLLKFSFSRLKVKKYRLWKKRINHFFQTKVRRRKLIISRNNKFPSSSCFQLIIENKFYYLSFRIYLFNEFFFDEFFNLFSIINWKQLEEKRNLKKKLFFLTIKHLRFYFDNLKISRKKRLKDLNMKRQENIAFDFYFFKPITNDFFTYNELWQKIKKKDMKKLISPRRRGWPRKSSIAYKIGMIKKLDYDYIVTFWKIKNFWFDYYYFLTCSFLKKNILTFNSSFINPFFCWIVLSMWKRKFYW